LGGVLVLGGGVCGGWGGGGGVAVYWHNGYCGLVRLPNV